MSRTKRNPYTGSKQFDKSCRSHGGCPACMSKRLHKNERRAPVMPTRFLTAQEEQVLMAALRRSVTFVDDYGLSA